MEDEQDPPTLLQVQELQKMFPHGHGLAPMSWVTGSLHEIDRLKKGHAYMVEQYKRDNDALREALYRIDHMVGGHLGSDNPTDVLCSAVEDDVKAALDPYPIQTVAEPAPLKAEGSFAFLESEPNLYDPKPAADCKAMPRFSVEHRDYGAVLFCNQRPNAWVWNFGHGHEMAWTAEGVCRELNKLASPPVAVAVPDDTRELVAQLADVVQHLCTTNKQGSHVTAIAANLRGEK